MRAVAVVSLCYDVGAGLILLLFPDVFVIGFGVQLPDLPLYVELNGLFLLAVGIGYTLPYRDPVRYRDYFWVFGVALKSAGAAVFVHDYLARGTSAGVLAFAAADAAVVALTLIMLMRR